MKKLIVLATFAILVAVSALPVTAAGVFFVKNGNASVGVDPPEAKFHVRGAGDARLLVEDTTGAGGGGILLNLKNAGPAKGLYQNSSTGETWSLSMSGAGFVINKVGVGTGNQLQITAAGDGKFLGDVFAKGVKLTSSRETKTQFGELEGRDVLARVADLPISQWRYKTEPEGQRHIGPMAEDFEAAFGFGSDGKHISVVDASGVALAAIQGLNSKVEEKNAEITALQSRLAELESLVASLVEAN